MKMNEIHSYPKVYALGHAAIVGLLDDPVLITEKTDGSQFSMALCADELHCRSRRVEIDLNGALGMFERAVLTAKQLDLHPGWVYRCEYIQKPKHNTLNYGRVPNGYLILFDIETADQVFLCYDDMTREAERLGLEVVPRFFEGAVESLEQLQAMLGVASILGGCDIEGIVIKNYARFGRDGKVFMGKLVSAEFKEKHTDSWRKANPTNKDVLGLLTESLRTEARWQKAVQHRQEAGELLNAPQDIGPLLIAVSADIEEEEADHIKEVLFRWALPHIRRGVARGFAVWYKGKLAASAFEGAREGLPPGDIVEGSWEEQSEVL